MKCMNELFVLRKKYPLSCPKQEESGMMRDQIFFFVNSKFVYSHH